MSQRANLIKCAGLVTNGSELTVKEGSLRQATNVNVDEEGVITPRRGFSDYGNPTADSLENKRVKQLFEYKDRLFRHYEDQLQFEDETGQFNDILGSFLEVESGYRIKWQESKGNMYFSTSDGINRISLLNNSYLYSGSSVKVEQAGVPKAAYMDGDVSEPSLDGFLDAQSKVSYRFLFGRRDSNNNLLLGSPSSRHIITNTLDRSVSYERFSININQDFGLGTDSYYITDGDYIVVPSSNTKTTFYFKTSSKTVSIPQNAETIGSFFVEVDISSTRNQKIEPEFDRTLVYEIGSKVSKNGINYICVQQTIDNSTDPKQIPGSTTSTDYWEEIITEAADLVTDSVQNNIDVAGILSNIMSNSLTQYQVDNQTPSSILLTSKEEGDIEDPYVKNNLIGPDTIDPEVSIVYTKSQDGEVTEGEKTNAVLRLIVPQNITEDYFVQLYRTSIITKPQGIEGITLNDLDPGDECNLVYETNITSEHRKQGYVEVTDDYPESFRASSTPLYTNEITGEGVLQANDPPPIALDIALFRNSMFYANTKSNHRTELTIISVDDFKPDTTKIIIGNSTKTRYYIATSDSNLEGGTIEGGNFLKSNSDSVAQSIDETTRSLVKVINQDIKSLVNAYYLSGPDDIPGKILLEARDLTDIKFYVSIQEDTFPDIGKEFNPEIPVSKSIARIRDGGNNDTIITVDGIGLELIENSNLFISYFNDETDPNGIDTFSGVFSISDIQELTSETEFRINNDLGDNYDSNGNIDHGSFSLEFTSYFLPSVESDNLTSPNRIYYSKTSEPEAVPSINFIDIGAKDERIERVLALRDNLFVMKGDGIYIVSGTSAPDFSVRLLDNTKILAPDSAVVLNNQIYCLTEQGITVVTDSGAGIISRGIENLIDDVINSGYEYSRNVFGIAYENDRAYIMFCPSEESDTSSTQAYRYNIFERTWSKWEYNATCGHVMQRDNKIYLGNGDINYVSKERKNFDRTDITDRNFNISVASRGVNGKEIDASSTENIQVNDVIVQEQEVSINYVNRRLLRKMDLLDTGLELSGSISSTNPVVFTTSYNHLLEDQSSWQFKLIYQESGKEVFEVKDYKVTVINDNQFSIDFDNSYTSIMYADLRDFYVKTFSVQAGDYMPEKLQVLHDYLVTRDSNIDSKVYTLSNMKENVDYLVDKLNDVDSITSLKDYKKSEVVTFEAYITEVNYRDNFIYSHTERPFLEQPLTIYKNIVKNIEWNPQHFGDPSALKQVRSVSIIFDQNNFYTAKAKFASDVVQSLTEVPVNGKGIAYFGDLYFDDPNAYWGGEGNDVPFRTVVPRSNQRCRYLTIQFEHKNAREEFRILGITGVVRPISDRGYR